MCSVHGLKYSEILLQIVMVSPATHIVNNYVSKSTANDSQLKKKQTNPCGLTMLNKRTELQSSSRLKLFKRFGPLTKRATTNCRQQEASFCSKKLTSKFLFLESFAVQLESNLATQKGVKASYLHQSDMKIPL